MALLRTENVDFIYSKGTPFEKKALSHVTFSLEKNEFVGIVGTTGSGKSTFIKLLNGLLAPKKGAVYFNEQNIWSKGYDLRALRFAVGISFQYPEHQIFSDTVKEDIAYGLKNQGVPENLWQDKIMEVLKIVGLDETYLELSPFQLSGGEIRRVALASIMVMRPQVLILDEPTAGLDPVGRDTIYTALKQYQKETESTILVVSHNMDDVAEYADSLLVMSAGQILAQGTPAEVFSKTEELTAAGLAVPEITQLLHHLKLSGLPIQDSLFRIEDAAQELANFLNEVKKDE